MLGGYAGDYAVFMLGQLGKFLCHYLLLRQVCKRDIIIKPSIVEEGILLINRLRSLNFTLPRILLFRIPPPFVFSPIHRPQLLSPIVQRVLVLSYPANYRCLVRRVKLYAIHLPLVAKHDVDVIGPLAVGRFDPSIHTRLVLVKLIEQFRYGLPLCLLLHGIRAIAMRRLWKSLVISILHLLNYLLSYLTLHLPLDFGPKRTPHA